MRNKVLLVTALLVTALAVARCGGDEAPVTPPDAGKSKADASAAVVDASIAAGSDAGQPLGVDASGTPAGQDASGMIPGTDAGSEIGSDASVPAGADASSSGTPDTGTTAGADAGVNADASVKADAGASPDAGPITSCTITGDFREVVAVSGGLAGPTASCAPISGTTGRNITVTCGGQAIDFSAGSFSADYDPDYDIYFFQLSSNDGTWVVEVDLYPGQNTCPATFSLPIPETALADIYVGNYDTWEIYDAWNGTAGSFELRGFTYNNTSELSYACTGCVLHKDPPGSPFRARRRR